MMRCRGFARMSANTQRAEDCLPLPSTRSMGCEAAALISLRPRQGGNLKPWRPWEVPLRVVREK